MIKKINIIGSGNVATQLAKHLHVHIDVRSVYSRTFMNARVLAEELNATPVDEAHELALDVDLNIVCLKDDAISDLVSQMDKKTKDQPHPTPTSSRRLRYKHNQLYRLHDAN